MTTLNNQIALVTGAGRGIGRAIALGLADAGTDVACVSRSEENAQTIAGEIRNRGRQAWAFSMDLGNSEQISNGCEAILKSTGRIDILVNNAGVTRDGLLMRLTEEDWDQVVDTNLKGAFLVTQSLVRSFIKQRSGRIINIASVAGLTGNAGQCNYAASKAGLVGFTKSAARELASRGITVNAIAPGFIDTDMTAALNEEVRKEVVNKIPMNAFGNPEDVAEAAVFLAGPGARYITGQVLAVDGGMTM